MKFGILKFSFTANPVMVGRIVEYSESTRCVKHYDSGQQSPSRVTDFFQ